MEDVNIIIHKVWCYWCNWSGSGECKCRLNFHSLPCWRFCPWATTYFARRLLWAGWPRNRPSICGWEKSSVIFKVFRHLMPARAPIQSLLVLEQLGREANPLQLCLVPGLRMCGVVCVTPFYTLTMWWGYRNMESAVPYMKCFHVNESCCSQHRLRWLTIKNHVLHRQHWQNDIQSDKEWPCGRSCTCVWDLIDFRLKMMNDHYLVSCAV
jgi:hypothetical protein